MIPFGPILRWSFRLMRWSLRLLRWSLRLAMVLFILGSFALNAALVTLAPVANAASAIAQRLVGRSAVETVVDRRTGRLKKRVTTLDADKRRLTKQTKKLERHAAALRTKNTELTTGKRRLSRKVTKLDGDLARVTSKVDGPSQRIARRVFRSAARNVSSTWIEWVPVAGGLTAVAVTALELRDSCATIADMNALRAAAGFEPMSNDWFSRTCKKVPLALPASITDMTVPECRQHAKDAETEMLDGAKTRLTDLPPPQPLREDAARLRAEIEGVCDCFTLNPGRSDICVTQLGAAR